MFEQYSLVVRTNADSIEFDGKIFTIDKPEISYDSIKNSIESSGITLEDLRSKTLCIIKDNNFNSILFYIALSDFAGRWLDLFDGDNIYEISEIYRKSQKLTPNKLSITKPDQIILTIDQLPDVEKYNFLPEEKDLTEIQHISYAKNLILILSKESLVGNVIKLAFVSAIRNRNNISRQPVLGLSADTRDYDVNLEVLRRTMHEFRKSRKLGNREATLDKYEISDLRLLRLELAGKYPIEDVLARLGSKQNEDTKMFHCPRPERHSNGDKTPSTKVTDGKVQCLRCDGERVDSLRLVMDTLRLAPDDAANWILN